MPIVSCTMGKNATKKNIFSSALQKTPLKILFKVVFSKSTTKNAIFSRIIIKVPLITIFRRTLKKCH
jgi:hypothetical protein